MGQKVATIEGHLQPNGFETISDLSSAVGITPPDGSLVALIQGETQNIRWRDDGTSPTAAIGMLHIANDILIYSGDMTAIEFIETTASASLNVTYYS